MTGAVLEGGMVIVGAGEAGSRAARHLRERGFDGRITLLGDEMRAPYERPPLSKSIITSTNDSPEPPPLFGPGELSDKSITHIGATTADVIDRAERIVRLADGRAINYLKLLVATGAAPRRLSLSGTANSNIHYLRSLDDALALRMKLRPKSSVLVIGGGFIGLEVASSAVARGCLVSVVEVAPRLLIRGVNAGIAQRVTELHRAAGVDILTGLGVEEICSLGRRQTVRLSNGAVVACDTVVAGVGAIPETRLARDSGLAVENGVRVDGFLRTDDAHIFAAGDCCSFPHPLYGDRRVRLEAWRNARAQGEVAAANMMGAERKFATVPWFWSDQYDQTLQVVGLFDDEGEIVERKIAGGILYFQLDPSGRTVAASAIGKLCDIAREMRIAELLIECKATPDPMALTAPKTNMKALLRQFQQRAAELP